MWHRDTGVEKAADLCDSSDLVREISLLVDQDPSCRPFPRIGDVVGSAALTRLSGVDVGRTRGAVGRLSQCQSLAIGLNF